MAGKAKATRDEPSSSQQQQRARIVQEYDRLIAQFGEEPFRPTAVCQRANGLTEVDTAAPKQRHELLKDATDKSLRCAELIEKALSATDKFKRMDEKIAQAHRDYEIGGDADAADEDEDMDAAASDDEIDEQSALLLEDLITASEEMQQAHKNLAKVGVVGRPTRASRELLSSTEHMLEASLASVSMGGGNAAAINDEFRDLYMEEFTLAFGDDLDQFRQEDRFEAKDVAYLISCIQSGADVFTPLQKKLFVESAAQASSSTK